jgi:hypothetical protein
MIVGYTAPLVRWVETVIEGYTNEPIILHGDYSQTYRPEHHSFDEHFVFEPQLEHDLSPAVLAELRNRNIRLIHVFGGISGTRITTYGYENETFHLGDLDHDSRVNFQDFALFGRNWRHNVCDNCGGADLTGDGRVTLSDLCELVNNWLGRK